MSIEQEYKIGDRVIIERYDLCSVFEGEAGTVTGYSPTGKFLFVGLDCADKYKCIDKWVEPRHVRREAI